MRMKLVFLYAQILVRLFHCVVLNQYIPVTVKPNHLSLCNKCSWGNNIFAGERFHYNPMKNCVPGAFFGRSPNGWINAELNHFAKKVRC